MKGSNTISCRTARHKRKSLSKGEAFWGYLFILPVVLGVYLFSIGPILYSFWISLTDWDGFKNPQFIALKNYVTFFSASEAGRELLNTLYFTLGTVPIGLLISIILANALNKGIWGKTFFRTVYFLPSVTMAVAVAIVWRWLFNSQMGLINNLLGYVHIKGPMWLGDPKFIMPAIIIVSIWSGIGYNMIILLSGLQSIPSSYYEAADIEGAGEWRKFTSITIPLLSPTVFFVMTIMLINAFKAFDIIYIFAGGADNYAQGPMLEATRTMVYGIFEKGFIFMDMGYASAEAVVLFAIIMLVTLVQFLFQNKWVHYE